MNVNLSDDLKAFDAFVGASFSSNEQVTLEDALREFRMQQQWQPRSQLGQRLKELRARFIAEGGQLLTAAEVAAEVRNRRGEALSES